jgi:ubiquinone/menaquinone biosynthesis C-methylase UbiE
MSEFDAKAATWDADPAKVERAARVARAILDETGATAAMNAFEYGCGTGLLGFALRPHLASVTLADSSPGMLEVLRRKIASSGLGGMTPVQLDLTTDPLPEARFDLVCTLLTLHHVEDTGGILAKLAKLVAPGGWLCVADLDSEDGSFHDPGAKVHHGFDRAAFGSAMARAGVRDVRIRTVHEIVKKGRAYPVFLATGRR